MSHTKNTAIRQGATKSRLIFLQIVNFRVPAQSGNQGKLENGSALFQSGKSLGISSKFAKSWKSQGISIFCVFVPD